MFLHIKNLGLKFHLLTLNMTVSLEVILTSQWQLSKSRSYQCKKMPILAQLCRESSVKGAEGMRCRAPRVTEDTLMSRKRDSLPLPLLCSIKPICYSCRLSLNTHLHLDMKPAFSKHPAPTRNESTGIAAVFLGGSLKAALCWHKMCPWPQKISWMLTWKWKFPFQTKPFSGSSGSNWCSEIKWLHPRKTRVRSLPLEP